eukprot:2145863-Rhodomonas_salina.3
MDCDGLVAAQWVHVAQATRTTRTLNTRAVALRLVSSETATIRRSGLHCLAQAATQTMTRARLQGDRDSEESSLPRPTVGSDSDSRELGPGAAAGGPGRSSSSQISES